MQEMHSTIEQENRWSNEWGNKIYYSHGKNNAKGVLILMSKRLVIDIYNVIHDGDGRYIIIYCMMAGKKFLLANVYAPNNDYPGFFQDLIGQINKFTPEYCIIGGDLNLVMDVQIDKKGGLSSTHEKASSIVKGFMKSNNMYGVNLTPMLLSSHGESYILALSVSD